VVATLPPNSQSHYDENLDANTTYYYRIRAFNQHGYSGAAMISGTTLIELPETPMGVTAAQGSGRVTISWLPSARADVYRVYRGSVPGGPYSTLITETPATSCDDTTVGVGETYSYVVIAYNGSGQSQSDEVAITLDSPPAAPASITATPTNSRVTITWSSAAGAASYNVKRGLSAAGPFTVVATASTTSYTDAAVVNGTQYFYVVSASNVGGEGANSAVASARPEASPIAPTTLKASAIASSRIDLSWADKSSNELGFKIERATSSAGPFTQIGTVGPNVRTFSNTGLSARTTYYYRVRAYHAVADSAYSNTASTTTKR
jgi:fibronectin type 3 domain-containing protein